MAQQDHFREAEALLEQAAEAEPASSARLIARAQAHATLALAQRFGAVDAPSSEPRQGISEHNAAGEERPAVRLDPDPDPEPDPRSQE